MDEITARIIEMMNAQGIDPYSAYSIREDGICTEIHSTENVEITQKEDKPGIEVRVKPGTTDEIISIPSCVSQGGIDDIVYNDFYIGENADVIIISGCGVNTDEETEARHTGVHRFFLAKGAKVHYEEKHIGYGFGIGERSINPCTTIDMAEDSFLQINSVQISGIDVAKRSTTAKVAAGAKLIINERLFTETNQKVTTTAKVELNGTGAVADLVSRSVAKDKSEQKTITTIIGNAPCKGHSECDAIISEEAIVDASPRLFARNKDAEMIHEAAIGKIAGEQLIKLQTFGLSEEEAEQEIIEGFLGE